MTPTRTLYARTPRYVFILVVFFTNQLSHNVFPTPHITTETISISIHHHRANTPIQHVGSSSPPIQRWQVQHRQQNRFHPGQHFEWKSRISRSTSRESVVTIENRKKYISILNWTVFRWTMIQLDTIYNKKSRFVGSDGGFAGDRIRGASTVPEGT